MSNNEINFLNEYSRFLDSSGKHLSYAACSLFLNFSEELSKKERAFLQTHLESCSACSKLLQEVREIEGEVPSKKSARIFDIQSSALRYAAAAVVVVGIGLTIFFALQKQNNNEMVTQQIESPPLIAEIVQDPAHFIPNQTLENFVERTVRSSSDISLIAPDTGDTVAFPFTFRWKGNDAGKKVVVTVVDNKNSDMWSEISSSSELTSEKKLEPGLYYIKLQSNDKLLQVGKFVVVR